MKVSCAKVKFRQDSQQIQDCEYTTFSLWMFRRRPGISQSQ